MLGRTHVIGGAAIGAATGAAVGLSPVETVALAAGAAVTAKLPDVDRVVNKGPNHRSLTHSVVFAGGLVVALAFAVTAGGYIAADGLEGALIAAAVWGLAVGYVSHLLLDSMTDKSVPLLWPGGPLFSLGSVATGKFGERLVLWLLLVVCAAVVVAVYGAV